MSEKEVDTPEKEASGEYDAIVIGSGIGGLAAASVLSQIYKKRVLVLERHSLLGGFTHEFSRKGFSWDVGLHYVGQLDPAMSTRNAFDFITQGQVKWQKMKSPFETFCYPHFRFEVSDDPKVYESDLINKFPADAQKIKKYFNDIHKIPLVGSLPIFPRFLRPLLRLIFRSRIRVAHQTVSAYMDKLGVDKKLASLLCSQWGDYGLPPSQASMLVHSIIVSHYLNGAYYPAGGAKTIAKAVQKVIEGSNGLCLVKREVDSLIIENDRIRGVRTRNFNGVREEYHAPMVFSNIGVQNLYRMIPEKFVSSAAKKELVSIPVGTSVVVLYLGLKKSPEHLGVHGQNFWIYNEWDHDEIFRNSSRITDGQVNACYVSFPSMKDPTSPKATAEIIAFVPYSAFENWQESSWRKRPQDYEAIKEKISLALLDFADREIPGLKDLVEYRELSTPLASKHFTNHQNGQIYGYPATLDRLNSVLTSPGTGVKGLYNVGADVFGHGIVGAMMGGIATVSSVMGWSTFGKVMKPVHQKDS
ncbi:MAG: phytoene desaturase family protein [Bacteriovoracaceae bacterium]